MIEYFSSNIWLLWVIIAMLCLLIELSSGDLFLLCFAIGALLTAIVAACGGGIAWQIIAFALASALSLLLVRPALLKRLHKPQNERLSNAEAIIGREGRVSQTIEANGYGRVAIDGDDWKACGINGCAIPQDARVRVLSMDSIIITVEPL